jgi:hypothetical protein
MTDGNVALPPSPFGIRWCSHCGAYLAYSDTTIWHMPYAPCEEARLPGTIAPALSALARARLANRCSDPYIVSLGIEDDDGWDDGD